MPETYGLPEEEPTKAEEAEAIIANVVAGQGIVRRVLLYVAAAAFAVGPIPQAAVIPLVLLMATDRSLA